MLINVGLLFSPGTLNKLADPLKQKILIRFTFSDLIGQEWLCNELNPYCVSS